MLNFEIAKPIQASILVMLWTKSFEEAYHNVHSPENIKAYCNRNYTLANAQTILSAPDSIVTFAHKQNKPVGVAVIKHHPCPQSPKKDATELKQLYLRSSEYGTGLGKMMMENAFKDAIAIDKKEMWLCVSSLNYRAQKFYRKMGFTPIGIGPILEVGNDRLPSIFMVRKLST